jgi:hypothetical protein
MHLVKTASRKSQNRKLSSEFYLNLCGGNGLSGARKVAS